LHKEISQLIEEKNCAPILIRLAWHDAGTYEISTNSGGPRGCMRFEDNGESKHGANAGLQIARKLLEPLQLKYCEEDNKIMSVADLWALASVIAIEKSGGPIIPFRFGRTDCKDHIESSPEGRLPDGDKGLPHLLQIFSKLGFNTTEIVALSGAHTLGKCHVDRSGFDGPWTRDPYKFDNDYLKDLLNKTWVSTKSSKGLPQFRAEPDDGTMMLSTDLTLIENNETRAIVQKYADSQEEFFNDFRQAFQKLIELSYNPSQLYIPHFVKEAQQIGLETPEITNKKHEIITEKQEI